MSCGCGNYSPPIVNPSTCESEYKVCKNSSLSVATNYTCNNLNIAYVNPINGVINLIGDMFTYTPNLDYIGTDTFTYDIYCNNVKIKTCTVTIVIEERDETTHTIELDACCNTVFIGEIISTNTISISEIKINNLLINTTNYGNSSSVEVQSLLATYLSNNGIVGEVIVTYDSVNYKYKFTISVKGDTITTISIKNTANSVVNLNKTQCGCLVGSVTYNWIFPENTAYVSLHEDSRITDCKIKVVLANDVAGSTIEDRTIKVEICCGACTDNCCKIEEWIYNPPTYGVNCEPICDYPCTTYNPVTGNCDYTCEDCQNCCGESSGSYYCADCCNNNDCNRPDCLNDNRICEGGNCYCLLPNGDVIPAPTDGTCCPQCTAETVPQCYECINGVIIAPNTDCPNNETYNYETCRCECNCNNGFCRNVLTGACVPCPPCGVITGLYTCNGQPYNPVVTGCNQCINGQIVPIICAEGYVANPHFNITLPISPSNPCCISLTPCDCDSPNCPNEGDICTHIDSLGDCYCTNCAEYSCNNTIVKCGDINGCECVNEACQSSCPSCTNDVNIVEYCTPYYVEYKGCSGNYLKFKVYELIDLLPIGDCSYENYLNSPISNKTDITTTFSTGSLQYNVTSSIFFEDVTLGVVSGETYILIDKTNVQTLLLSINKYNIATTYEFIFNDCLLADITDPDTNLVIATNPRLFRESCKTIYGLSDNTTSCNYNEYTWEFENSSDEELATEIQNGKYIVIIPTNTASEVCLTANLVLNNVICSQYEQCITYNTCIGGCGCNPCTNNGNFLANIETVNNSANGTITASASVLLNCNGDLNALLATCEPATGIESCFSTIPDRNGTSPLPFSDYSDYMGNALTPCQIFGCTGVNTGCEVSQEAPCGWLYEDSKLEVLWYNGANIGVGFISDNINGKLCWGANYECGYYCDCITVVKEITCEDYGINSVSLNCPQTYTNTNLGSIIVDVNNFGDNYTVAITKCGKTTPVYTTTSNLSTLTIPILNLNSLGTIINGTCLDVKVTFITGNLHCEYNEQLTYNCCITPTLTQLTYNCDNGLVTEVNFTTNIASNLVTISITDTTGNLVYNNNQSTIIGANNHIINGDISDANIITIIICDDSSTDCCITNTISVVDCQIPCEVDINAEYTCNGTIVDSLVITGTSTILPINVVVTNGSNSINYTNVSSTITVSNTELATLNLQDNDNLTITATNDYPCSSTITEIIDCSLPCNISSEYTYRCEDVIVTELLLTVLGYYTSYSITGTLYWSSNTNTPTIVSQTINVTNISQDIYTIIPPQNYPNVIRNCVYGTLTITDENGCQLAKLDISCELCPYLGSETYNCVNGNCINTMSGVYGDLFSCKSSCEQAIESLCGDVITVIADKDTITERLFDLQNLTNNSNYYVDISFGGKPESYEVYQVDVNNNLQLLLKSPNLGCNCVNSCVSLSGFWTNVSNLDNLGNYNAATVTTISNPFIFSGNNCGWSGYIPNSGEILPYIPDDCTWIPHYDTNCIVNANRDYDTCGTCVIGSEETVNAKALGRMYFNYDNSYGNILLIRVFHGTPSCNTGLHGVKFKLVCENTTIFDNYSCINGSCIQDNNGIFTSLTQCQQDCTNTFCLSDVISSNITDNGVVQPSERHIYKPIGCTDINTTNTVNATNSIYQEDMSLVKTMLNLPNVLSYGIGNKVINGITTKELAYVFIVSKKTDNLANYQKIPKIINGYKTDVIVGEIAETFTNCNTTGSCTTSPVASTSCVNLPHRNNHKHSSGKTIMKGGISAIRETGTACTFSVIAKDNTDNTLVGIACTHCFKCTAIVNINGDYQQFNSDNYIQTSTYDVLDSPLTRTTELVGTFKRDYPVQCLSSNNLIDACVITLDYPYNVIPDTSIFELTDCPLRWATQTDIQTAVAENWKIEKSGRTLGTFDESYNFTCSSIIMNYSVNGCYTNNGNIPAFDEILYISQSGSTKFGTGGDSSSPVIIINPNTNEKLLAGMLFAGSCSGIGVIPMYNIANLLNVSAWNGDIIVNSNNPIITVNGKQYAIGASTNEPITHEID